MPAIAFLPLDPELEVLLDGRVLMKRVGDTSLVTRDSGMPEIGGSSAGFIALVVVLAVIFLSSCIGVFLLLRNHQPSPHERQARLSRKSRANSIYELPMGPPGLRTRLAGLFGKRHRGWIRAETADEWDAADDVPLTRDTKQGSSDFAYEYSKYPQRSATSDSVDAELTVPSLPFQPSTSAPPVAAQPVSESPPHDDVSPPSTFDDYTPRDARHFSVQSIDSASSSTTIRSMQKFESGTKFKEALDF